MASRARRNIAPAKTPQPISPEQLSVIILAAKMGRRMKSRGPKCLFELRRNLTILDTQLQSIWCQYSNADIVIVADFGYESIRKYIRGKYPARIVLNPYHDNYGLMHGIGIGLQATASKRVLVMYGDLVVCPGMLSLLSNASALHVTDHENKQDEEIGVTTDAQMNVTNLAYGLPHKWCQMAYFTGDEFDMLEQLAFHQRSKNWMFHEGINDIITGGGNFISYSVSVNQVLDVDSPDDLEKARRLYDKG